jgi:hypothetical protein
MSAKNYIDTLFSDYQETPALADFKEELCGYLSEQVSELVKRGMDEKSAFEKATKDLGDMSAVADEVSLRKKQEVLSEMYMKTRSYISAKRGALYALCGLVLGAGILIPLITWFASEIAVGTIATILPFAMVSILGFLFLGLTQETAAHEPMRWKRAIWYVLSVGLVLFGVLAAFITHFDMNFVSATELAAHGANPETTPILGSLSVLMIFALPGIALGIFLILTEKERGKPWVIKQRLELINQEMERFGGAEGSQRFGLLCGAIWIAAISVFVLLTILIGIKFSWLAIVAALVIQMIVMAILTKSK